MPPKSEINKKNGEDYINKCEHGNRNTISFQDDRESLNLFTGDDTYSITKWIADLEEMRDVYNWSDVELFVYRKRLLSGTAALYIRSETGIFSWDTFRHRLLNEFQCRLTDADTHRQLAAKKKYDDETCLQYLFKMQGAIPDDSVID